MRCTPAHEQLPLPLHQSLQARGTVADEKVGEADFGSVGPLGLESGLGRKNVHKSLPDFRLEGPRLRAIERNQRISSPDHVTLADVDRANDPAFEMLNGLAIAVGADDARGEGRARQRGEG
ncbi:hypothetical protein D9M68_799460 [compost metagenome]